MVSFGELRLRDSKQTSQVIYFLSQFQQCRVKILMVHTLNTAHSGSTLLGGDVMPFKHGEAARAGITYPSLRYMPYAFSLLGSGLLLLLFHQEVFYRVVLCD